MLFIKAALLMVIALFLNGSVLLAGDYCDKESITLTETADESQQEKAPTAEDVQKMMQAIRERKDGLAEDSEHRRRNCRFIQVTSDEFVAFRKLRDTNIAEALSVENADFLNRLAATALVGAFGDGIGVVTIFEDEKKYEGRHGLSLAPIIVFGAKVNKEQLRSILNARSSSKCTEGENCTDISTADALITTTLMVYDDASDSALDVKIIASLLDDRSERVSFSAALALCSVYLRSNYLRSDILKYSHGVSKYRSKLIQIYRIQENVRVLGDLLNISTSALDEQQSKSTQPALPDKTIQPQSGSAGTDFENSSSPDAGVAPEEGAAEAAEDKEPSQSDE